MENYKFTSESVTEGHPDKLCDTISDKILDEYLKQDSKAKVAVETMAGKNRIYIAGQITANAKVDIEKVVKNTIQEIGYDNDRIDLDYRTCKIEQNITIQSPDISKGIKNGGAGDQGLMFGYACDETEYYMPYGAVTAHELSKKLTDVRKKNILPYLRPDGKTQVTIEYENGLPKRIDTIIISAEHLENIPLEKIRKDIKEAVIFDSILTKKKIDNKTKIKINPAGVFTIGGPLADTGLTGRKIIVDTYGGYAHHGGGAFSGKDASKVDRSAAYMLRYIAKQIVKKNLAKKCEIQIAYAIGEKDPVSINVNTFGTGRSSEKDLEKMIYENYDLTPDGIIKFLELDRPVFSKSTNYGHFGNKDVTWER